MGRSGSGGDETTIVWFRSDLRIADNAALSAAAESGPVVPVFIRETASPARAIGGARRWWLHHSLRSLGRDLAGLGSPLVLTSGDTFLVLTDLARRTGARRILWNRRYDPAISGADAELKSRLKDEGFDVRSFAGWLLHEPTKLKTGTGGHYRVFTPFWRALIAADDFATPITAPKTLVAPETAIASESLSDWDLLPKKPDWAGGLRDTWEPGESGAQRRLAAFLRSGVVNYADARDFPGIENTSRLSPHLAHGEITPAQIVAALSRSRTGSERDREVFRKEVGWREFSWHLLVNEPSLPVENHNRSFDGFPWADDAQSFASWRKGMTGYPIVDAGLRQLWQTGWMHNRVRMIVASFLTKHLLIDWRSGKDWFWDTLVDADIGSNTASWQWVAGCGADAAPYFRIFNPVLQGEKFDPTGAYVRAFVPELARLPDKWLHKPWMAARETLSAAGVRLGETYPQPIVDHQKARDRALAAYGELRREGD